MDNITDPAYRLNINQHSESSIEDSKKPLKKLLIGIASLLGIFLLIFVLGSIDRTTANDSDIVITQNEELIADSENAQTPLRQATKLISENKLKDPAINLSNGKIPNEEDAKTSSLFKQVINNEQYSATQLEATLQQWSVIYPFIIDASGKGKYQNTDKISISTDTLYSTNTTSLVPTRQMIRAYAIQALIDSKNSNGMESIKKYQELIKLINNLTSSQQISGIEILTAHSSYSDIVNLIKQSRISNEEKSVLNNNIKDGLEKLIKQDVARAERNEYTMIKNTQREEFAKLRSFYSTDDSNSTSPVKRFFVAVTSRYHYHFNSTQSKIAENTRKRINNASQGCNLESSDLVTANVDFPKWREKLLPNGYGESNLAFFNTDTVSPLKLKICFSIKHL